jgi:small-conductance mechanosensitive channel
MLSDHLLFRRPPAIIHLQTAMLLLCWTLSPVLIAATPDAPDSVQEMDSAPVTIDGETLFRVVGAPSYPAPRRAEEIRARVVAAARDATVAPDAIRVVPQEDRFDVLAGERRLVSVIKADAEREGVSAKIVAEVFAANIRKAIETYRAERQPESLLRAGVAAGVATAAAVALLLLTLWAFRRTLAWIEQRYRARIQAFKIDSFEILRAERVWSTITGVLRLARFLVIVAVLYLFLEYALEKFPWTRGFARWLLALIIDPLRTIGAAVVGHIPETAFLIVLFFVTRYLLKGLGLFTRAVESGHVRLAQFDPDWAQPTYKLLRALIVVLALVIAFPYIPGSSSGAFQGISIFVGVLLSLGASSAVSSIIAGYSMTYRRAFRIGDRISSGDFTGEVTQMRLMVTHLRTIKNEEIVVPNSLLLTNHIVNYSRLAKTDGLILHTTVGIGYEAPWRQVEAMLIMAATRTPGLLRQPAPFVLEKSLGDFAIT